MQSAAELEMYSAKMGGIIPVANTDEGLQSIILVKKINYPPPPKKQQHTNHTNKIIILIALINALSTHMIHINLDMIFCTHVEHSPTKTIYTNYYTETHTRHNELIGV